MGRKKFWGIAGVGICGLLLGAAAYVSFVGRRPFKDLDAAEIAQATVWLVPPDRRVEIVDTQQLAEYLRDAVIYRRDGSHTRYAGQGVIFTLTMTDGTRTEVVAYNPFLIIDGVGYRTKYGPCETLSRYANNLLGEQDAPVILEEPPALLLYSGQNAGGALLGTYSWQRRNYDGTTTGICADAAHPLDCKERLRLFDASGQPATLCFAVWPDEILSVRCWSDEHWGDPAAASEDVTVAGDEILLKPGNYIYEIHASWDAENGYSGTARYVFYVHF